MECGWPPGGAPFSTGGADLPAQPDSGQAEPHGSPGQSRDPPSGSGQASAVPLQTTAAAPRL